MQAFSINDLDWKKVDGLLPAIIQDATTGKVLMLGYMNQQALEKTLSENKVTFFSRTKQRLWTKGEESGNALILHSITMDCDQDTLLIQANPVGPTCHLGHESCFGVKQTFNWHTLHELEQTILKRQAELPEQSYTADLFKQGTKRIAQKVGEEGVEVALAATTDDMNEICSESADLIFHLLVLLNAKGLRFSAVIDELRRRG